MEPEDHERAMHGSFPQGGRHHGEDPGKHHIQVVSTERGD